MDKPVLSPEETQQAFIEASKPMIKWLNDHAHPHATAIITPVTAELLSSETHHETHEFVKD